MSRISNAGYWNKGVALVPQMTGASTVMDCPDLLNALRGLGVAGLVHGRVLDVGCGTGRARRLLTASSDYLGVDISRDAIAYCENVHVPAILIGGPEQMFEKSAYFGPDVAFVFSVFTHIGARMRERYLQALYALHVRKVFVDIIPGDGSGNVELWTAAIIPFEQLVARNGFTIDAVHERQSPDVVTHRYYKLTRAR